MRRTDAEAEIRNLNNRLKQASRLIGMGEMAASLAHDLANGLSAILQYTHGANRRAERGTLTVENAYECIQDIEEQAHYMRDVLMMIQQFVRTRTSERVPVRLPAIIEQSELLMRSKFRQKCVQLERIHTADIPPVLADPAQITLVLVNLMLNAMQAMLKVRLDGRRITISLQNDEPEFVEVSVRDQGPGIPPEMIEKVFEKFFTTKEDGLGLGLAFSRAYIEQHGGRLWCETEPGQGCNFCFTLPVYSPGERGA